MFRFLRSLMVLLAAALSCTVASSQSYPSKTISVVVPYGAGGGTDLFARLFATELASRLKQTVIVENVPGAGGTVAIQRVMNTAPDGHTLVVSNGMEFEMLQMADPVNAGGRTTKLTPVFLFGTQPMVLTTRASLGLKTAQEFIAAAKARPGALTLASAGPGTSLYLAGEMIKKSAGIELLNVPYKSAPQIVTDLVAGNVDAAVLALPTAISHIRSGTLTALGVTDPQRSPALPNVPPLTDTPALKGIEATVAYAIFGPPGLPAPIVNAISEASAGMLKDPAFTDKLLALMITPARSGGAEELDRLRTKQLARFREALPRN